MVTLFGVELFRLDLDSDGMISGVYERLRSSGRFIWITIYAGSIVALLGLPRAWPSRVRGLAVMVLALQAWDLEPLRARSLADSAPRAVPESVLETPQWQAQIERADYVYMSRRLGLEFSLEAGAAAFPLNTPLSWFYTAQGLGLPKQIAAEEQLRLRVLNGNHDENAIYLLDPGFELPLIHRNGSGFVSTRDFGTFSSLDTEAYASEAEFSEQTHGLTEMLEACLDACTALIVAHDRTTRNLSVQLADWLGQRGSRVLEMRDGDGFALVVRNGEIVDERIEAAGNATLNALVAERAVSLLSSVVDANTPSSIAVDGVEFARGLRGLNVLIMRDTGQLVSAVFDTEAQSDSILPDGGAGAIAVAAEGDPQGLVTAPARTVTDVIIAAISGPISGVEPAVSSRRLLSEDASLLDVLSRCRQECAMAISVKDEASANLPFAVRRLAAQMGLTLAELSFREGYAAIVENGIVLVQGRSQDDVVDVAETVKGGRIRVRSAGFDAGNMTSIEVDGVETALGHRGLNISVIFPGGESISYHFDTHGAS